MPLYSVDFDNAKAVPVTAVSYAGEGIKERQNLQRLIANNLSCIDPDLFLITESFKGLEGSLREIDILALDRDGNLVIVELKRTDGGEYADLQAIRYAAMLSSLTLEDVARIYAQSFKKDVADAELEIRGFLSAGSTAPSISDRPRIYLVAPSFEKEIAMTCLWLINANIDIRCIQAGLYKIGDTYHIKIEQELPQPSAQQYQYRLRNKEIQRQEAAAAAGRRRRATILVTLEKAKVLKPGTPLVLRDYQHYLVNVEPEARRATFYDRGHSGIEWGKDKKRYNLSTLTETIFQTYANTQTKVNPTELWQIEGEERSLFWQAVALTNDNAAEVDPIEEAIGGDGTAPE